MTTVYVILGVLAFLTLLYLFLIFPTLRRHPHRRLLDGMHIAHRGLHDLQDNIPENSLAAFREAVKAGFAIENDIHITADGEVVVFHDDTLNRMCGVDGKIEELTLSQLRELRLKNTDETIPTLRECLDVVDGQVPLLIEFKCNAHNYRALCEAADALLQDYNGLYFVQSFFPSAMGWYRRHRKEICRGQLASSFAKSNLKLRLLGSLVVNVSSRPDFISFDHQHERWLPFRLVKWLGAFPVGWTFRSQDAYAAARSFRTYIFELFLPRQ